MTAKLSASVVARLLNLARQRGDELTWTMASLFPVLLDDLAAPSLKVYPVYTVIAEKYHAMTILGLANTRMKDFFDIATIARRTDLDGATLARAIGATFSRRGTALPTHAPVALTGAFGEDDAKDRQWQVFLRKGRLDAGTLAETVNLLHTLLWPASQDAISTSWRLKSPLFNR